jgi:hypothetical protein
VSQISRLHNSEIANGNLIDATHLNNELNQLVSESNNQDTRLTTAETTLTNHTTALKGYISGLVVQYSTNSRVIIKPGSCRDGTNTDLIEVPSDLTLDITTPGANGIDTGTRALSTWYYVWVIKNVSSGVVAGLFSTSSTSPLLPAGYTKKRLLPIAVRNDANNNFIPFRVAGGWPYQPRIAYTTTADFISSPLNIINGSSVTTFTATSLTHVVPPISRFAIIHVRLVYSSASANLTLRSTGDTNNGWDVGGVSSGSTTSRGEYGIPTDANQSIDRKVSTSGASFDLDCVGYVVTEVL